MGERERRHRRSNSVKEVGREGIWRSKIRKQKIKGTRRKGIRDKKEKRVRNKSKSWGGWVERMEMKEEGETEKQKRARRKGQDEWDSTMASVF